MLIAAAPAVSAPKQLKKGDVVLVSCPGFFAGMIRDALKPTGARVLMAEKAEEIAAATREKLSVVFLCDSSRISDETVALREKQKCPMVIVTGAVAGETMEHLKDVSGATEAMLAPFGVKDVTSAVTRALNPPKLTAAQQQAQEAARRDRKAERERGQQIMRMTVDQLLAVTPPVKDSYEGFLELHRRIRNHLYESTEPLPQVEIDVHLILVLWSNGLYYFTDRDVGDRHEETAAALDRAGFASEAGAVREWFAFLGKHGATANSLDRANTRMTCCGEPHTPAYERWKALREIVDRSAHGPDGYARLRKYLHQHRAALKATLRVENGAER